jgi:hypothetical protein
MKQIYAVSLALLAASSVATNASAGTVTFNCPNHSDQVQILEKGYDEDYNTVTKYTFTFEEGATQLVLNRPTGDDAYDMFYIALKPGSDCVMNSTPDFTDSNNGYIYKSGSEYCISFWTEADTAEDVINIDVMTMAEKYTNKFYLKIDDPSQASLSFSGDYRTLDVSSYEPNTEYEVLYDASSETAMYVYNQNYSKTVYKVYVDDVETSLNYSQLAITENSHVSLVYTYPDVNVHVTLTYVEDTPHECISKVTVDEEEIEDYENGFDVKLGSIVEVYFDKDNYNCTYIERVGTDYAQSYVPYSYSFTALEDTEIKITAAAYKQLNYTVNIEDPTAVKFYTGGSSWSGTLVELSEGENQLTISENNNYVYFYKADNCKLNKITDGEGNTLYDSASSYNTYYYKAIEDGDVLNVDAYHIVFDKQFVLYFDDPSAVPQSMSMQNCNRESFITSPAAGYTTYDFTESYNPFYFSFFGLTLSAYGNITEDMLSPNNVYINDVKQDPIYANSANYQLTIADKDVVKLFFASNPEFYNVSFEVPEDVEMSVVKDLITEASTEGFQALPGTQVDLKVNTEDGYDLYVNDEKVETEENAYSFNVAANTVVKLQSSDVNGVSSVSADSSLGSIYNLQGIKVGTDRNQLPAGIYILNGKKIAIK